VFVKRQPGSLRSCTARPYAIATRSTTGSAPKVFREGGAPAACRRIQVPRRDELRCRSLAESDARRGVAAHSSGNHAAALALAAATRGVPAYVVMPANASAAKRAAVERLRRRGDDVATTPSTRAGRGLARVLERTGAIEIHPFDDERVIAGAGHRCTRARAGDRRSRRRRNADRRRWPVLGDVYRRRSRTRDRRVRRATGARRVPTDFAPAVSSRTGAIPAYEHDVEQILVDEPEIVAAMRVVWERTKQLIEPSAAVAFAAARAAGPWDGKLAGARVGVICSGGQRRSRFAAMVSVNRDGDARRLKVSGTRGVPRRGAELLVPDAHSHGKARPHGPVVLLQPLQTGGGGG